jgi:hypothetical protein
MAPRGRVEGQQHRHLGNIACSERFDARPGDEIDGLICLFMRNFGIPGCEALDPAFPVSFRVAGKRKRQYLVKNGIRITSS